MRRIVIDVLAMDERRARRVASAEPRIPTTLRATPAEIALHRQICRAERERTRGGERRDADIKA